MKLNQQMTAFRIRVSAHFAALIALVTGRAAAASLDLANAPAAGESGKFAAEEIRREAAFLGRGIAEKLVQQVNRASPSQ